MCVAVDGRIPRGGRLGVIGGASFFHPGSERTCVAIGKCLAGVCPLAVITGGRPGVGETIARSFFRSCCDNKRDPHVYHLLPVGSLPRDQGTTLYCGENVIERREVLARVAGLYLSIEGGPGTRYEAEAALANGAIIIPVGRFGGYSKDLYGKMPIPHGVIRQHWNALGKNDIPPDELAGIVTMLVSTLLDNGG